MTAPDRSKINPTFPLHRRGRPQMTAPAEAWDEWEGMSDQEKGRLDEIAVYTSNEILVPGAIEPFRVDSQLFAVQISFPPVSHRYPRPLWQKEFDRIGGVLVHVGDRDLSGSQGGRFALYEAVRYYLKGRSFEFVEELRMEYAKVILQILEKSDERGILVTFDVWLGSAKPVIRKTSVGKFLARVLDGRPLRTNTCYTIVA